MEDVWHQARFDDAYTHISGRQVTFTLGFHASKLLGAKCKLLIEENPKPICKHLGRNFHTNMNMDAKHVKI